VDLQAAYETLDVAIGADEATVRSSYRAMVKVHHPDAGGTAAGFQQVAAAFQRIARAGFPPAEALRPPSTPPTAQSGGTAWRPQFPEVRCETCSYRPGPPARTPAAFDAQTADLRAHQRAAHRRSSAGSVLRRMRTRRRR
jgi:hypothetical protein